MDDGNRIQLLPTVSHPISSQQTILCCPERGSALVPAGIAHALIHLGGARTVEEHCHQAEQARHLEPELRPLMRETIRELRRRGFFLETPPASGEPAACPEVDVTIETLGLMTRERPDQAAASARSYLTNAARAGRRPTLVICDDSRLEDDRRENLEVAQQLVREGTPVRYLGLAEKEAYAARLARTAGLPEELVRVAILDPLGIGFSRGANTNALMLDTVGEVAFCFDDDSFCRPARPDREAGEAVVLGGPHDLIPTLVFPDVGSLLEHAPEEPEPVSLLGEHERWLGKTLPQVLAGPVPVQLDQAGSALLVDAARGRGGIRLTWSGIYGDSGSQYSSYYLTLTGAERERLLQDEPFYRSALEGRTAWKAPTQTRIGRSSFFQSVAFAMDNRGLLPPFLPFYRASDTVFARLLRHGCDHSLVAHLPWSVFHDPQPRRQQSVDDVWRKADALRLAELVELCLDTMPPPIACATAEERLRVTGRHLRDLSRLPSGGFEALVYPALMRRLTAELAKMEWLLQIHEGQPAFWAEHVRRAMEILEGRLLSNEPLFLDESPPSNLTPALSRQVLVGRFGELVEAWPTLRAAGLELRQRGVRASRALHGSPAGPAGIRTGPRSAPANGS
jgi:hypothetical protein